MAFPTTVQTPNIGASFQILYADVTGDGIADFIQDNGLLRIGPATGMVRSRSRQTGAALSLTSAEERI